MAAALELARDPEKWAPVFGQDHAQKQRPIMTATCRLPCCASPRQTVSELLERGLRRNRATPLSREGTQVSDADGNAARFSIDVRDATIADVGFRMTSCATLVAYGELIAETVAGMRIELANGLTARDLVDALPGVPALKRDRAVLAVAAFRSALSKVSTNGKQS
jgi:NifU-like protein involved in Fe-S cluster formation